jgi:hypothetical protein
VEYGTLGNDADWQKSTDLGGEIAWLLRRYLSVMIDQDLSPVEWRRSSFE